MANPPKILIYCLLATSLLLFSGALLLKIGQSLPQTRTVEQQFIEVNFPQNSITVLEAKDGRKFGIVRFTTGYNLQINPIEDR